MDTQTALKIIADARPSQARTFDPADGCVDVWKQVYPRRANGQIIGLNTFCPAPTRVTLRKPAVEVAQEIERQAAVKLVRQAEYEAGKARDRAARRCASRCKVPSSKGSEKAARRSPLRPRCCATDFVVWGNRTLQDLDPLDHRDAAGIEEFLVRAPAAPSGNLARRTGPSVSGLKGSGRRPAWMFSQNSVSRGSHTDSSQASSRRTKRTSRRLPLMSAPKPVHRRSRTAM